MASTACAPAITPLAVPAPHLMLAQATPGPSGPVQVAPTPASDAPAPPPAPASPPAPRAGTSETRQERDDRQLGRTWGWVFVSVGGVASVLAIGTSVLMLENNSTRNSDCNAQKVCSSSGITANTALSDLAGWNTAAWIVAAAGLGAGAYFLLTHPTDKAMGTQVGVSPNGSGANLQLRGSF